MSGASEHRYLEVLDSDLAKALVRAARRARKSPDRLLNEVVLIALDLIGVCRRRSAAKVLLILIFGVDLIRVYLCASVA